MQTVTNLFLINLAASDLLLTIICMPTTYTGYLYSCFFYGPFMCPVISYMQPLTVAACANTLVAIALERYRAICRPLQSQHWKTKRHALVMITCVWLIASICTIPSAICVEHSEYVPGKFNCRDTLGFTGRNFYYAFIILVCFIIPLFVMTILYILVILTLRQGIQMENPSQISRGETSSLCSSTIANNCKVNSLQKTSPHHNSGPPRSQSFVHTLRGRLLMRHAKRKQSNMSTKSAEMHRVKVSQHFFVNRPNSTTSQVSTYATTLAEPAHQNYSNPKKKGARYTEVVSLRSTHAERSLVAKKRVIRMLIMIVVEFFVCWTPLYAYFALVAVVKFESRVLHLVFLLLAYTSLLTNPVTYCFVNAKFRRAMLHAVGLGRLADYFSGQTSAPMSGMAGTVSQMDASRAYGSAVPSSASFRRLASGGAAADKSPKPLMTMSQANLSTSNSSRQKFPAAATPKISVASTNSDAIAPENVSERPCGSGALNFLKHEMPKCGKSGKNGTLSMDRIDVIEKESVI